MEKHENEVEEDSSAKRHLNAEYFSNAKEFIKLTIQKVEQELETAKNKKVKGGVLKKHKEKLVTLSSKLGQLRKYRDRIDEILISMDYVESLQIKNLQVLLDLMIVNSEDVAQYS